MPEYRMTVLLRDDFGGETIKQFIGDFGTDAAATTAAAVLLEDLQDLTTAGVVKWELAQVSRPNEAPEANSNVFMRLSANVNLETAGKTANVEIPAPIAGVFTGNALDTTAAEWIAFIANFDALTGWELSDGEHYGGSTNRGKRINVRSGSTNLPV